MAKKKSQPKKSNVTITMNGEVVLSLEVDYKLFKSFSSGFVSGISPFLSRMTSSDPLNIDDFLKKNTPTSPMTKEEIDELIKKYSTPEEK